MGGGGSSGSVEFPDYVMDVHGLYLQGMPTDNDGDFTGSPVSPITTMLDVIDDDMANNPYTGFSFTNPATDISAWDSQFDLFYDNVTGYVIEEVTNIAGEAQEGVVISETILPELGQSLSADASTDVLDFIGDFANRASSLETLGDAETEFDNIITKASSMLSSSTTGITKADFVTILANAQNNINTVFSDAYTLVNSKATAILQEVLTQGQNLVTGNLSTPAEIQSSAIDRTEFALRVSDLTSRINDVDSIVDLAVDAACSTLSGALTDPNTAQGEAIDPSNLRGEIDTPASVVSLASDAASQLISTVLGMPTTVKSDLSSFLTEASDPAALRASVSAPTTIVNLAVSSASSVLGNALSAPTTVVDEGSDPTALRAAVEDESTLVNLAVDAYSAPLSQAIPASTTHVLKANDVLQTVADQAQVEATDMTDMAVSAASAAANRTEIDNLVNSFNAQRETDREQQIARFNAQMADGNAVQSSAYMFGLALLQAEQAKDTAQFETELRNTAWQSGYQAYVQGYQTYLQAHGQAAQNVLSAYTTNQEIRRTLFDAARQTYLAGYESALNVEQLIYQTEAQLYQVGYQVYIEAFTQVFGSKVQSYLDTYGQELQAESTIYQTEAQLYQAAYQTYIQSYIDTFQAKVQSYLQAYSTNVSAEGQVLGLEASSYDNANQVYTRGYLAAFEGRVQSYLQTYTANLQAEAGLVEAETGVLSQKAQALINAYSVNTQSYSNLFSDTVRSYIQAYSDNMSAYTQQFSDLLRSSTQVEQGYADAYNQALVESVQAMITLAIEGALTQENLLNLYAQMFSQDLQYRLEAVSRNKQAKEERYQTSLRNTFQMLANKVQFEQVAAQLKTQQKLKEIEQVQRYEGLDLDLDVEEQGWQMDVYEKAAAVLAAPSGMARSLPGKQSTGRFIASQVTQLGAAALGSGAIGGGGAGAGG